MKHLFRPAAIAATLLLCAVFCQAQLKIGSITVDSETAKKYIADCYLHPDTVRPKSMYDFLSCTNCSVSNEEIQRAKIMADDFNENLIKYNIGEVIDTVHYEAHSDTLYDGVLFANYDYKKDAKNIEIEHQPAWSYVDWKGYLMPRKPSEQDFVKWYAVSK